MECRNGREGGEEAGNGLWTYRFALLIAVSKPTVRMPTSSRSRSTYQMMEIAL